MSEQTTSLRRNLRRYEWALVAVFMAVLIGAFMQRMQGLEARAERAGFDLFVGTLRERIRIQNVVMLAGRQGHRATDLAGSNPVGLFQADGPRPKWMEDTVPLEPPASYLGEVARLRGDVPAPGEWVFARRSGVLAYRVRDRRGFGLSREEPDLLRFALAVDFVDRNGNGRFDAGSETARGLVLKALDNWREAPL